MSGFLFVGERPSPKAERIGATWQNGKLAGRTLRLALLANGIDPDRQTYINLWQGSEPDPNKDTFSEAAALATIALVKATTGVTVVALGRLVSRELTGAGIKHLQMVHPAARGKIRRTDRYQAHVAQVLSIQGDQS